MTDKPEIFTTGSRTFKEGPVIYHPEDYLIDEHKTKKLTLLELNKVFNLYLKKNNLHHNDLSILAQFSIIFNNPMFSL